MGKPKGLVQLLWDNMFMETSKDVCTYYTLHGRDNNYGSKIIETSLRELIQNYEETLVKTNDFNMGERRDYIIIDHTPKFQPEISGEGIEHSWGCAKDYYRKRV